MQKLLGLLALGSVVLAATVGVVSGRAAAASGLAHRASSLSLAATAVDGHRLAGRPLDLGHVQRVGDPHSSTASGSGFLTIFQEDGSPAAISVGGAKAVTLGYGEYSYGLVPSGTYVVTASRKGSTIATGNVTVAVGQSVIALLYPAVGGKATITGFNNDLSPVPTGMSRVVFRNTANAGPLDIYVNGTRVAAGLTNDPSAPSSVTLVVRSGKLKILVVPAGEPESQHVYGETGIIAPGDLLNAFVTGRLTSTVNQINLLTNANPLGVGYRLYASDGGVFDFGVAHFYGSMGGQPLNKPIVGAAPTSLGFGYWLVAGDGGIFAFGGAGFEGSTGGLTLNKPVVGMAATPDSNGYWLVASDGGIFSFGDAAFYGSTGGIVLNRPVVGMASTPNGDGYWLVASDGGVFAFGDAHFYGSTGSTPLNKPIVAIVPTVDGRGYWLVASDGGVFAFGDAHFYGSMGGTPLNQPVVAAMSAPDSLGYWLVASDGGVFSFGDAQFYGSTGAIKLNAPVVAASAPGALLPNS